MGHEQDLRMGFAPKRAVDAPGGCTGWTYSGIAVTLRTLCIPYFPEVRYNGGSGTFLRVA